MPTSRGPRQPAGGPSIVAARVARAFGAPSGPLGAASRALCDTSRAWADWCYATARYAADQFTITRTGSKPSSHSFVARAAAAAIALPSIVIGSASMPRAGQVATIVTGPDGIRAQEIV